MASRSREAVAPRLGLPQSGEAPQRGSPPARSRAPRSPAPACGLVVGPSPIRVRGRCGLSTANPARRRDRIPAVARARRATATVARDRPRIALADGAAAGFRSAARRSATVEISTITNSRRREPRRSARLGALDEQGDRWDDQKQEDRRPRSAEGTSPANARRRAPRESQRPHRCRPAASERAMLAWAKNAPVAFAYPNGPCSGP
jgi:hypothetical protein